MIRIIKIFIWSKIWKIHKLYGQQEYKNSNKINNKFLNILLWMLIFYTEDSTFVVLTLRSCSKNVHSLEDAKE